MRLINPSTGIRMVDGNAARKRLHQFRSDYLRGGEWRRLLLLVTRRLGHSRLDTRKARCQRRRPWPDDQSALARALGHGSVASPSRPPLKRHFAFLSYKKHYGNYIGLRVDLADRAHALHSTQEPLVNVAPTLCRLLAIDPAQRCWSPTWRTAEFGQYSDPTSTWLTAPGPAGTAISRRRASISA